MVSPALHAGGGMSLESEPSSHQMNGQLEHGALNTGLGSILLDAVSPGPGRQGMSWDSVNLWGAGSVCELTPCHVPRKKDTAGSFPWSLPCRQGSGITF